MPASPAYCAGGSLRGILAVPLPVCTEPPVGSPPLIGVIWAAANGSRHKAMRPGRWVAEWHMLPSQTHCTQACSPGWAVVALGLATPRRSAPARPASGYRAAHSAPGRPAPYSVSCAVRIGSPTGRLSSVRVDVWNVFQDCFFHFVKIAVTTAGWLWEKQRPAVFLRVSVARPQGHGTTAPPEAADLRPPQ